MKEILSKMESEIVIPSVDLMSDDEILGYSAPMKVKDMTEEQRKEHKRIIKKKNKLRAMIKYYEIKATKYTTEEITKMVSEKITLLCHADCVDILNKINRKLEKQDRVKVMFSKSGSKASK